MSQEACGGCSMWIRPPRPDSGNAPLYVEAEILCQNMQYDYIMWDWGDGTIGAGPEINSHTYTSPGIYFVHVQFNYGTWVQGSCDATVEVLGGLAPIIENITVEPTAGTTNTIFTFHGWLSESGGIPTYARWTWADTTFTEDNNPGGRHLVTGHQYSFPGMFYVNLYVSNSSGSDSKTIIVVVGQAPPPIECEEGEQILETCPDNTQIPIRTCINNEWVETGLSCPPDGNGEGFDMWPIVIGIGLLIVGGIVIMAKKR